MQVADIKAEVKGYRSVSMDIAKVSIRKHQSGPDLVFMCDTEQNGEVYEIGSRYYFNVSLSEAILWVKGKR
jgi:hypothetical protein